MLFDCKFFCDTYEHFFCGVPKAEGSGTIVLSASASSSKDEITTGVIDGIDVAAILVPEEDAWQFEAAQTCTTETQLRGTESRNRLRL